MELIPVLDLRQGQAVHARRGLRDQYRPVASSLLPGRAGDALGLGQVYREKLGAARCYVADLDAIQSGKPQLELLASLADPARGFGPHLLVDAGLSGPEQVASLIDAGAETLIAGLETLAGFAELAAIVKQAGGHRVIFSLDLMEGLPVRRRTGRIATQEAVALELGARAMDAGCHALLVLDFSAVGSEAGPRNLGLLDALKRMLGLPVYAGGGVRSKEDLRALEAAGCDAVLVGTALHKGALERSAF
jgi:phosphoribosylformimino-5-aminoimidazole carboxamide ribotide isomerase